MSDTRHNEFCKSLRKAKAGPWERLCGHLASKCSDHIASCPRCRRRLAKTGRVELMLCLMRTQPHGKDLTAKANTAALNHLKRSLRQSQTAEELRNVVPTQPTRLETARPVLERLISVAACLLIILMIRTGLSRRMFQIKDQGTRVMQNYYARNLDAALYEDIFGPSSEPPA